MPRLFSRDESRQSLGRRAGAELQFGGVTPLELADGRSRGVRALLFRTGRLTFLALADRALDLGWCDFEGRPLAWMSANGIVGPQYYEPERVSWMRSFYGGLVETCGLSNVGAPSEDAHDQHGLHGRIGNLPVEELRYGSEWQGDECVLWAEGSVREPLVREEQLGLLVLTRRIETRLGGATISLTDVVDNRSWRPAPFLLLYHVNAGYPLLDAGSRLHLRSTQVRPRTAQAEAALDLWQSGDAPHVDFQEQVFDHLVEPRPDGWATATLVNPDLDDNQGLALAIHYRAAELPRFWQWRMLGEGNYVMGLEPSNCGQRGRTAELAAGEVRWLQPGEQVTHRVELEAGRGRAEVERLVHLAQGSAPSS